MGLISPHIAVALAKANSTLYSSEKDRVFKKIIEAITSLIDELEEILSKDYYPDRFNRWKQRVVYILKRDVSIIEAKKFEDKNFELPNYVYQDIQDEDDYDDLYYRHMIQYYKRHLEILLDELRICPEVILKPENESRGTDLLFKNMHPQIHEIAKDKFDKEFYTDAVLDVFKELILIIKKDYKSKKRIEEDGKKLMGKYFSESRV